MLSKETMNLYIYSTGKVDLKRWSKEPELYEEGGFFIEHNSFYEGSESEVIARGKTLKECIADYLEEERFSKKTLFCGDISNDIIENFELSKEDTDFIIEFCEWADF